MKQIYTFRKSRHDSYQPSVYLMSDNLHDAVVSIKFSVYFQHTNNLEYKGASEAALKAVDNGGAVMSGFGSGN